MSTCFSGLADRNDLKDYVFKGSDKFLTDEITPVISTAANKIIEFAENYSTEKPLYAVGIGGIRLTTPAI